MPRELRLDYGGNSFRWFDTDEMLKVHGSSQLPGFLAQNIEQHFKVPMPFQVLCDLQGPLSTQDFQRVLSGEESPRLWLFDSRYMGDDLRKQFERRRKADQLERSQVPESEVMALGVQKLSESLERREQQVAQMLNHHAAEIDQLQRELTANRPPRPPGAVPEAKRSDEDAVSFFDALESPRKLDDDDSSIQLLAAEEAMLLQSVQEALAKISTPRTPSTTFERRAETQADVEAPRLDLTDRSEMRSEVSTMTCRGDVPRGGRGPLPPGSSEKYLTSSPKAEHQKLQRDLEEALTTARRAQEEEKQSQLLLKHWQARATAAEEALKSQENSEAAQVKLQCQLEVEVALRQKDLAHLQEIREVTAEMHQSELLQMRHRNAILTEQEEWQQMEILLLRSQQMQSEKAQEQQVLDLMSSIEWERLSSEMRCSQLGQNANRNQQKTKDLGARLVGRDLEVLALETLMEAQRQQGQAQAKAQQEALQAREEAKKLAAELKQKVEELQKEKALCAQHLAEITQQSEELRDSRSREAELKERMARLESELQDAQKPPKPPTPDPTPPAKVSDYISSVEEELDMALEKEVMDLGPGCLKGNTLERTGPKRYKLGDQKVFMQLSDGRVTVRVGGAYVPLNQWTRELTAAGEKGNDDPFSALDASSPFAAVR